MKLRELMKLQREQKEVKNELEEANMENLKVNNNTDIVKLKQQRRSSWKSKSPGRNLKRNRRGKERK